MDTKCKKKRSWEYFLSIVILLFIVSVPTYANEGKLSHEIVEVQNESMPLKDVLKQIEKETSYSFFYDANLIDLSQRVIVKVSGKSIEDIMNAISNQTELLYKITKKQITLYPQKSNGGVNKKNISKQISGRIVDENGDPVTGANIIERGTTNWTVSDYNGEFSLNVASDAYLEISLIGYVKQIVKITQSYIIIILQNESEIIDEVVVTGYGLSQKKATLTGAIATIGNKDISHSIASTASGALVGKVAGLNTRQADGRPGSTTILQIRNMGTPLYVIDGVQSDAGQFNNLDFNDIESISVLKDASAAIYGVRAANGVIVITTKKGKRNSKSTVSFNTYYGWQSLSKFPKPANAITYLSNYIQSQTVQGVNYTYSKEDFAKWQKGTEKGYIPFDWYDYIWQTSPQYYANVNVSGGSDKINYYVSIGHINQNAMIVNYGGFKRTNVQMNIDAQITNKFKIGASMNGRIEERKNPGVPGMDDYWLPIFATYRNLPTRRPFANDNPNYPTLTAVDPSVNFAWLNYKLSGLFKDTWRVAQLQANAEYEIIDGLKAKAMVGYYFAYNIVNNQEYTYKLYGYDEATNTYPVIFENKNPWRERTVAHKEDLLSNVQLSYDNKFGNHSVSAMIGLEATQRKSPSSWLHSIPTANSLHLIDYETMDTYRDYGDNTQARLGWLFHGNYDYAGKYLIEFSGRYDGSWKFPPHKRWGFFPSASIGYRISEENFWKDSKIYKIITNLKIRGSYGLVGSDNVSGYSPFDYMVGYNYKNGGSVIDGEYVIGSAPRGLPVTTLSWIKAKILDIGFDIGFFNNRLIGQFDFFRRLRSGIPASRYDVLIPSQSGFSLPLENLNSDVIKGCDGIIKWSDKVRDFSYSIGANFTYSRYYTWYTYKPRFSNSWSVYTDSPTHRIGNISWGQEVIGQFQSWEEIANWPIDNDRHGNTTLRPGDLKYKDVNNDGVINAMDKRPIGYRQGSTPIVNFGFNFAFEWKGFDLAFDLTGSAMNSWRQLYEQKFPFHDGGNNPQYYMEDTWHLADIWDANSKLIPGKYPMLLIGNSSHNNYRWDSTFWTHNTVYMKLRNFEFGYTIQKKNSSKNPYF